MTKVSEIKVNLGNRTYPIYIGNDLFSSFEKFIEGFSKYQVVAHCNDAPTIPGSGGLRDDFINDFNLKNKRHEIEQRKQRIFSVVYVQTTVEYKRLALDRRY